MHLARAAGVNASEARLVDSDGIPVTLIRRFDRTAKGRLMYVSAATLLGADIGAPTEHAYTEIVNAIRQHGAAVQILAQAAWSIIRDKRHSVGKTRQE
jgi:serine/threonine-protein kinase HipA